MDASTLSRYQSLEVVDGRERPDLEFHTNEEGTRFWKIPRDWEGETCVVVGTGPSLTPEDVDYCRGKARVIVVNDGCFFAPWADLLHGCDGKWWGWSAEQRKIKWSAYADLCVFDPKEFDGYKTTLEPKLEELLVLHNTGPEGFDDHPWCCRTGHNGGYQAVNIAMHFGCKRIVLLGMDHTSKDGKYHFFGDHPDNIRSTYPNWFSKWQSLLPHLDRLRVSVVNCSRQSALLMFKRAKLEDTI